MVRAVRNAYRYICCYALKYRKQNKNYKKMNMRVWIS